jgi:hypothetical protein
MIVILTVLVVVLAVENSQNRQEQVQDIQVKADRSSNLLLDVVVADNKLRVHENVSREDQRSDDAVSKLHAARLREESGHETKQNQHPERTEQVRHPASEVVLGLARKECKGNEDTECEDQRLQDDAGLEHAGDHRDAVSLESSEGREECEIHRLYLLSVFLRARRDRRCTHVALALPVSEQHESDCAEHADPHHPLIALYPFLVRIREEAD